MEEVERSSTLVRPSRSEAEAHVMKALLVMNPAARGGRRALAGVIEAFRRADVDCEVVETRAPSDATELVRDRLRTGVVVDAVFTLGGDGTAMEVATALADFPDAPPLGILAVGTANVLARSLGIPVHAEAAVGVLLEADVMQIDLGRIAGGPHFAIGLGIGLDAMMISGASSIMKRRVGYFAYAWSAMRAGLRLERFKVRVTVDGTVYDFQTSSVLVANFGTVLGDLVCFGEQIGHQDGLLDVCVYSPSSLVDALRIFWRMLRGGVSEDRCVRIVSGRHIRIETDPPRLIQADGELLGMTPVEISVEPNAVRLLVPRVAPRRWRLRRLATARVRIDRIGKHP
jgi:YegS/Rv2252/BmrU family lipid kinase